MLLLEPADPTHPGWERPKSASGGPCSPNGAIMGKLHKTKIEECPQFSGGRSGLIKSQTSPKYPAGCPSPTGVTACMVPWLSQLKLTREMGTHPGTILKQASLYFAVGLGFALGLGFVGGFAVGVNFKSWLGICSGYWKFTGKGRVPLLVFYRIYKEQLIRFDFTDVILFYRNFAYLRLNWSTRRYGPYCGDNFHLTPHQRALMIQQKLWVL